MTKERVQKINDLIFKELIKRGYSLEGNTRIWDISDSKLWYLTPEQAQAFLDLESSQEYKQNVIQKEIDLVKNSIEEIKGKLEEGPLNIIDLGCGDGKKAVLFIENLKGSFKLRYCPIDISGYMVEKAIEKVSKKDVEEVVKLQWNISDFENLENIATLLRKGLFKNNLFLLLGNTLGNFEIHELLYEIRSSMHAGDFVLIGNGLNNEKPKEILKSYQKEQQDNFLRKIVNQIGLKNNEVEYGVRFANSRVEAYYTILKNKKIKFQNKVVDFNEGDQIVVAYSYKYNKEDFLSFLNLYFDDVMAKVSKDGASILALCKK